MLTPAHETAARASRPSAPRHKPSGPTGFARTPGCLRAACAQANQRPLRLTSHHAQQPLRAVVVSDSTPLRPRPRQRPLRAAAAAAGRVVVIGTLTPVGSRRAGHHHLLSRRRCRRGYGWRGRGRRAAQDRKAGEGHPACRTRAADLLQRPPRRAPTAANPAIVNPAAACRQLFSEKAGLRDLAEACSEAQLRVRGEIMGLIMIRTG
jgi:hypothetical protein